MLRALSSTRRSSSVSIWLGREAGEVLRQEQNGRDGRGGQGCIACSRTNLGRRLRLPLVSVRQLFVAEKDCGKFNVDEKFNRRGDAHLQPESSLDLVGSHLSACFLSPCSDTAFSNIINGGCGGCGCSGCGCNDGGGGGGGGRSGCCCCPCCGNTLTHLNLDNFHLKHQWISSLDFGRAAAVTVSELRGDVPAQCDARCCRLTG